MAIGPKVGSLILTPTVTATSLSSDGTRIASNVNLLTRPDRTWRSNTSGSVHSERLTFDLGASLAPAAVVIYGTSAPGGTMRFEAGPDGSSWPTNVVLTVNTDARDGRRKKWYEPGVTQRWYRLSIETLAPATYAEINTVVFLAAVQAWSDPIGQPLTWQVTQAATKLNYIAGGGEVNQDGAPYLRGTLGNAAFMYNATVLTDFFNAVGAGKGVPLVWYDNLGDDSQVVIGQRDEDVSFARSIATFEGAFAIEAYT